MENNFNPNNMQNNQMQNNQMPNQYYRVDDTGNPVMFDKNGNVRKMSFWKDGLSINETKVSTLIICLLACVIFAGITYVTKGDISTNLTTLMTTFIWGIAGINIADRIGTAIGSNSNNNSSYYNGYYNSNSYTNNPYSNNSYYGTVGSTNPTQTTSTSGKSTGVFSSGSLGGSNNTSG